MKTYAEQQTIRRYLLGQTPQEELVNIEERVFCDDNFYDELLIAEDELIDQYIADQLSSIERHGFETHFLTPPERQRKVRFARNLKRYVGAATTISNEEVGTLDRNEPSSDVSEPAPKRSFFSFLTIQNPLRSGLAAATVLLMIGGSLVVFRNWRNATTTDPGKVLAVVLTPGLTRDAGTTTRISITSDIDTLQLRLELPEDNYVNYQCSLLGDDRSVLWSADALAKINDTGKNFVVANIPARLLSTNDYRMKVSGRLADGTLEDLSTYAFRVAR